MGRLFLVELRVLGTSQQKRGRFEAYRDNMTEHEVNRNL